MGDKKRVRVEKRMKRECGEILSLHVSLSLQRVAVRAIPLTQIYHLRMLKSAGLFHCIFVVSFACFIASLPG